MRIRGRGTTISAGDGQARQEAPQGEPRTIAPATATSTPIAESPELLELRARLATVKAAPLILKPHEAEGALTALVAWCALIEERLRRIDGVDRHRTL